MESQSNSIQVRLVDLVPHNNEITVPQGAIALFDSDRETFKFQGKLTNFGTLLLTGNTELSVDVLVNKGRVQSDNGNITLRTNLIDSDGEIESPQALLVSAHPGNDLKVIARAGTFKAVSAILLHADKNITVSGGSFHGGEIRIDSLCGDVAIRADELDGPVFLKAVNASCGTRRGKLEIKEQCLDGDPIYYCTTGPVILSSGAGSASEDTVILAHTNISVNGAVNGRRVILAAGVNFQQPTGANSGTDCDSNAPAACPGGTCSNYLILGPVGPGTINVNGPITATEVVEIQAQGNITIQGAITGKDIKIEVPTQTGDVTVDDDITSFGTDGFGKVDIKAKGKIELKGSIQAQDLIRLFNAEKDIKVKKNIRSTLAKIEIETKGNIELVHDDAATSDGEITAGKEVVIKVTDGSTGKISVGVQSEGGKKGNIKAEDGKIEIKSQGPISINGDIEGVANDLWMDIQTPTSESTSAGQNTIKITGKVKQKGGNVFMLAGKEVAMGDVDLTGDGSVAGVLDVFANQSVSAGGASTAFVIGGTDSTNGINGKFVTATQSGGGNAVEFYKGGIKVENMGNGGIEVKNATDISISASSSKNGGITFDAKEGKITLPAGTFSVDGQGTNGAGLIVLLAREIIVNDGNLTLSASDQDSGLQHAVWIAADKFTHGANRVTLNANGTGGPNEFNASVLLLPTGGIIINDTKNPADLFFDFDFPPGVPGPINLDGSGKVTINSNGDGNSIIFSGYQQTFSGAMDVTANGSETFVAFFYEGPSIAGSGLSFNGGKVNVKAQGTADGEGGLIVIRGIRGMSDTNAEVIFDASALGAGTGGAVLLDLQFPTADALRKVKCIADGDSGGNIVLNTNLPVQFFIRGLSARHAAGGTPGSISINQTNSNGGLDVRVTDFLFTNEQGGTGDPSGLTQLTVLDTTFGDVSLVTNANTLLGTTFSVPAAREVTINAKAPATMLGIQNVAATSGKANIFARGLGSIVELNAGASLSGTKGVNIDTPELQNAGNVVGKFVSIAAADTPLKCNNTGTISTSPDPEDGTEGKTELDSGQTIELLGTGQITGERVSITTPTTFILSDSHTLRAKKKVDGVTIEAATIHHEDLTKTLTITRDDGDVDLVMATEALIVNGTVEITDGDIVLTEPSVAAVSAFQTGSIDLSGAGTFIGNRLIIQTNEKFKYLGGPGEGYFVKMRRHEGIIIDTKLIEFYSTFTVQRLAGGEIVATMKLQGIHNEGRLELKNGILNLDAEFSNFEISGGGTIFADKVDLSKAGIVSCEDQTVRLKGNERILHVASGQLIVQPSFELNVEPELAGDTVETQLDLNVLSVQGSLTAGNKLSISSPVVENPGDVEVSGGGIINTAILHLAGVESVLVSGVTLQSPSGSEVHIDATVGGQFVLLLDSSSQPIILDDLSSVGILFNTPVNNIQVATNQPITVAGGIVASRGSINIVSEIGISLLGGNTIHSVGAGILFSIGEQPQPPDSEADPNHRPANVSVTAINGAKVFWGANSVFTQGSHAVGANTHNIRFDTGPNPATSIKLLSNELGGTLILSDPS